MATLPFYQSFYLSKIVYYAGYTAAGLFVLSYFVPLFFAIASVLLLCTGIAVLTDMLLLYAKKAILQNACCRSASAMVTKRVTIQLKNRYAFMVRCEVIEELPYQFQERTWQRHIHAQAKQFYAAAIHG